MLYLSKPMLTTPRRFTKTNPCPVCGGHDGLGRGQGVRCFGYLDSTGEYARCTREDKAGGLPQNRDGTYSHRLHGTCRCGQVHGDAPTGDARPAADADRRSQSGQQRFRSYFTLAAFLQRLRRGIGHHPLGLPRRRRAARPSACCASTTSRRTARKPRATAPAIRARTGGGCCRGRPACCRSTTSRPSSPHRPEAIVTVLEGEKCADIAAALGLAHATTSAHGAQAPQLTDWSPLAGRSVAILRDEGERGADYAAKVAAILAALDPPAEVRDRSPAGPVRRRGHRAMDRRPPFQRPQPTPRSSPNCVP